MKAFAGARWFEGRNEDDASPATITAFSDGRVEATSEKLAGAVQETQLRPATITPFSDRRPEATSEKAGAAEPTTRMRGSAGTSGCRGGCSSDSRRHRCETSLTLDWLGWSNRGHRRYYNG